jgi:hypothetical protein
MKFTSWLVISGKMAIVYTNGLNYETFWTSVIERDFFVFSVRACKDVYLALSEYPGAWKGPTYEFVIGKDNSRSYIRDGVGGSAMVTKSTEYILQCDVQTYFWIMWSNNTLAAGLGSIPGNNQFINVYDPNYNFPLLTGVAIATSGQGEWHLGQVRGKTSFKLINLSFKICALTKSMQFGRKFLTDIYKSQSPAWYE